NHIAQHNSNISEQTLRSQLATTANKAIHPCSLTRAPLPMATTVMASTATSLVFAATGVRAGCSISRLPAAGLAPRRRTPLVVRAAQNEDAETKPTKPKAASIWDALAFSGPAPERINGRLAMVGFVSALAVEAARGEGLLAQAGNGAGLTWARR
ncbi:unnamed protein product, partial [Urochloa humidicola]